eukprot:TRINITY_DN9062_c0_g1_i1.p1 TRINITY_DN9062_c0_g1~~TRINITY_DN9062_c0_g1_i1.p1  ORF type:complete len:121 (+),score=21.96 TRINITY_DN9062_c0_g1_i1:92-454(+)
MAIVLSFNDETIATWPVSSCPESSVPHRHSKKFTYYKNEERAREATKAAKKKLERRKESRKKPLKPMSEALRKEPKQDPKPEKIYPTTVAETFGFLKSCAKIGRAVQQECRDRSRMPSSA